MTTNPKRQCLRCGAPLSPEAQFCHACGAPQASTAKPPIPMPLLMGGFLVVLVAVAVASYEIGRSSSPANPSGGSISAAASAGPPDISNLSPRQAADSLFNMVMRSHQDGDFQRVNMFAPMAIQAYANVGVLDPDAHYHLGLIHLISGDFEGARAEADSMEQAVPNNLLAIVLRHNVAQMQGDSAASVAAYRRFLANYDQQIGLNRPEYQDHSPIIDNFRQQAQDAVGG